MLIQTPSLLNKIYSRITNRLRSVSVDGIPKGLTFDEINELCIKHFDDHLVKVSYEHLSSWKAAGSYRLFLKTKKGIIRRLVYKNAVYNIDHIPALQGLPVIPGNPEYLVYKNARGASATYLPNVYLVKEVIPQKHYQYFLEDLNPKDFTSAYKPKLSLTVAQKISALHQSMDELLPIVDQTKLLRYDRRFSLAIEEYFHKNLESYLQKIDNQRIQEIYKLCPRILNLHARQEFQDLQVSRLIHGDLNGSNILIHKKDPDKIKFIDWEWAGLGNPHADLVSLVSSSQLEVEHQALAIFAKQNPQLSLSEHKRLYQWCKLERGLLDAAFMTVQQMQSSYQSKFLLSSEFIENAMEKILNAYLELA